MKICDYLVNRNSTVDTRTRGWHVGKSKFSSRSHIVPWHAPNKPEILEKTGPGLPRHDVNGFQSLRLSLPVHVRTGAMRQTTPSFAHFCRPPAVALQHNYSQSIRLTCEVQPTERSRCLSLYNSYQYLRAISFALIMQLFSSFLSLHLRICSRTL
jgi:hypothetical protein